MPYRINRYVLIIFLLLEQNRNVLWNLLVSSYFQKKTRIRGSIDQIGFGLTCKRCVCGRDCGQIMKHDTSITRFDLGPPITVAHVSGEKDGPFFWSVEEDS